MLADPVQIEQVLHNLIRNALEALADCGPCDRRISISARRVNPDRVEIVVENGGPPIPQDIATRVFEPFFSTKEDGMGMGLYISRLIIDSHKGVLRCVPRPDSTAMQFTLPIA